MKQIAPAPWSTGGNSVFKTVLKDAKGNSIASGGNNRAVQGEVLENSLRLASAAPELLAALKNIQANPNDPRAHRQAMDAMTKAEQV